MMDYTLKSSGSFMYSIAYPLFVSTLAKDATALAQANALDPAAGEFMRFLIAKEELNAMASVKRLITSTRDLSLDSVYAPFGQVPAERTISPEVLGITDPLTVQIRVASFKVGTGELTVDEAVQMYGTFE